VNMAGIGQAQPQGTVTAMFTRVQAGTELREAVVTATLQPGQPLSTQLVVKVQDAASHNHQLKADVVYQPDQVTVHLRELVLALPEGSWQLAQPGTIVQRKTDLTVERLLLVNGDQQLLVEGNLSLTGTQELRAQISRLALAGLRPLLPQQPDIHGLLTAQIHLSGSAAAPQLAGTVQVADLQIAGQSYQGLSATVAYKERNAAVEVNFQQDTDHALNATGRLPLAVSWAQGWNVQVLGDMDVRIRSTGVNLAFLNAFTGEAAQNVAGELNVDLALQGPVSHPRPQGSFRLRDGQAMLKALGVHIAAITVDGTVDPEHVHIQQISATARDGTLQGNATLTLRDYQPQRLTASLTAERWPAIHTSQYQVEIGAQMRCEGPITAPTVNGRLEVLHGILRPDLEALADSPVRRDETIVVIQPGAASAATKTEEQSVPIPSQGNALQNLAFDVTVQVHRNTWIKHQNADIELTGEVRATKQPEGEPMLVGSIETVRGWVGFKGRRFTLSQGRVIFSGESEINPQLDIIAQHQFPEYRVDTVIGGTAKAPSLTLRSDPELEQADILALLLFGQRANALGSDDKTDLQQQALGLTAGYAASQIAQSVSQALGLEDLGIDLREADIAGGHVGFGRYLSPNTYVSISQEVGGKRGREVSVEYHLGPAWQLNTSTSAAGSGAGILWHKQY
jgi:autotransporter translocation and assembly factor TamB